MPVHNFIETFIDQTLVDRLWDSGPNTPSAIPGRLLWLPDWNHKWCIRNIGNKYM